MKQVTFYSALLVAGGIISGCVSNQVRSSSQVGFHPVNLNNYYDKKAGSWPAGRCWAAVPWGPNTYDGVPFECGGIIEVTGIDAARRIGDVFPGRYTGIPVESRGDWIHIVGGVGWAEADGVPIARLTLHYENGETSTLVIRYGVHMRNWWQEPSEREAGLADRNSKVIWSAPNPEPVGRPTALRLYKTSFSNPHPGWAISAIDIESLFSHATPVVLAITVGKAGEAVQAERVERVSIPGRFTQPMVVTAAESGTPVREARVEVSLSDGERNYAFGAQTTDAEGRTVLDFSREQVSQLSLNVSAPGYQPLRFTKNILDLPEQLELKLQPQ